MEMAFMEVRGPTTAGGSSTVDDIWAKKAKQSTKHLHPMHPVPISSHLIHPRRLPGVWERECVRMGTGDLEPGPDAHPVSVLRPAALLLPTANSQQPTAYRRVHRWHPHARPKPHGRARPPAARRACWLHLAEQKAELLACQTPG